MHITHLTIQCTQKWSAAEADCHCILRAKYRLYITLVKWCMLNTINTVSLTDVLTATKKSLVLSAVKTCSTRALLQMSLSCFSQARLGALRRRLGSLSCFHQLRVGNALWFSVAVWLLSPRFSLSVCSRCVPFNHDIWMSVHFMFRVAHVFRRAKHLAVIRRLQGTERNHVVNETLCRFLSVAV